MKSVTGFLPILCALFTSPAVAETLVVYGQVGSTVTLPRERWVTDHPYVKWFFGNVAVIQRNTFGRVVIPGDETTFKDRVSLSNIDSSLTIKNIRQEEFKSFRCDLESSSPKMTDSFTYNLYTVSVTNPGSPVLAGETIYLTCEVAKSFQGVQIRWQHPQKQNLTADTRIQSTGDGKLTVYQVTSEDHGEWTCVVTYQGREAHANTLVTVIDLSPVPPQPLYTSTSSFIHLPCSLLPHVSWSDLNDKGIQKVEWTFSRSQAAGSGPGDFPVILSLGTKPSWNDTQNKKLFFPALEKSELDLTIGLKKVTVADRGIYTCSLKFKSATLKREIHVEVLNVVASPRPEVFVGQQVNLTCSLGHPLTDDLKLKWSRTTLPSVDGKNLPSFTISEAREGDSGRWRCELLRNNTRLATQEIYLKIVPVPIDVWLMVTILAAAVVFILLLILTVILIRRHKNRLTPRRRKPRFCRCKDPKPKGFYRS